MRRLLQLVGAAVFVAMAAVVISEVWLSFSGGGGSPPVPVPIELGSVLGIFLYSIYGALNLGLRLGNAEQRRNPFVGTLFLAMAFFVYVGSTTITTVPDPGVTVLWWVGILGLLAFAAYGAAAFVARA